MSILGPDGQPQTSPQPGQPSAEGVGPSPTGDLIKEATDQSFMADVLEPSREVPVLVDFWAPWCGPCRQLTPLLENAVKKAAGAVKLVKINIDENPGVAGQLRIQSIPAVIAFQNGQPVDGFMGALPESQILDFIARLAGDVSGGELDTLLERAETAMAEGDLGGAAQDFAAVIQKDPENTQAIAGLARVHLASGDTDAAKNLLDQVPEPKKSDPAIAGVRAAMELSSDIEAPGDLSTLKARVGENPQDPAARLDLARALIASGDLDAAAGELLESLRLDKTHEDGAARQLLLKVFDAAGPDAELTKSGRRRLSSILFS